jgi:hypothetical protein
MNAFEVQEVSILLLLQPDDGRGAWLCCLHSLFVNVVNSQSASLIHPHAAAHLALVAVTGRRDAE